jgi:signal transduction histidine kinase
LTNLELMVDETGAVITLGELPVVPGNPFQLEQLFQNLVSNALKFHLPGVAPQIDITASQVAAHNLPEGLKPDHRVVAYYRIDVRDNGIGFDEKYLDRIFGVFQRLHGKSEFAGTGIGLAICEKVVINHGGLISAQSQPGRGATFSVFLPDEQ